MAKTLRVLPRMRWHTVSIGVSPKLTAARENGFDVVLIDTAGRMQDNEPLMRALAKVRP